VGVEKVKVLNRYYASKELLGVVETVGVVSSRDKLGSYLQTAPAATGVEAARSQLIGCSVERGNSDLWRLREMTSGEDREEEYRC
jgi:hypothetical protein